MTRSQFRVVSSCLGLLFITVWPAAAAEMPSAEEYEIRLAAHQRELMQREADLEAARLEIRDLHKRAAERVQKRERVEAEPAAPAREKVEAEPTAPARAAAEQASMQPDGATPADPPVAPAEDPETAKTIATLQQDLDTERDRRATLEQELARIVAEPRDADSVEPLRRALEGADAEILVLREHVASERRTREALEVDLQRVRAIAGVAPSEDWIERFATTLQEREEQANRVEHELGEANQALVTMKARLETVSGSADPHALDTLAADNAKLRSALAATERANADLRTQADMAAHLAEMLYAQSR